MYQILIVDDEAHAVKGIQSGVDWEKISVSKVLCAYNLVQAQEQFAQHRIDIMICDIEMPRGNGLQLLEWVREHYPLTESIFLTCHADFNYAKQAIHLGCHEYLLKPALYSELEEAVGRAARKIDIQKEQADRQLMVEEYRERWSEHQLLVIERLWLQLMNREISSQPDAIRDLCRKQKIPYPEGIPFRPICISVQSWHRQWTIRDSKRMDYAVRKAAGEIFFDAARQGFIIKVRPGAFIAILEKRTGEDIENDPIRDVCHAFTEACSRYFYCDLTCYVGEPAFIHEIAEMVESLNLLELNHVTSKGKVFFIRDVGRPAAAHRLPSMENWPELLKRGSIDQLITEINLFFEPMMHSDGVEAQTVRAFFYDFMQMVYYTLQLSGLQAHPIFMDGHSRERAAHALLSVTHLREWVLFVVRQANGHIRAAEEGVSVADRVKRYIRLHMDNGELSREDMANHVFLNAAYLSRLFKKETGLSLTDYLVQERMTKAKELLENTEMSISEVASTVGYVNFSHFSKMFKKTMNLSPYDFRQQQKSLANP